VSFHVVFEIHLIWDDNVDSKIVASCFPFLDQFTLAIPFTHLPFYRAQYSTLNPQLSFESRPLRIG